MIDTDKYEGHSTDYIYEIEVVHDGKELMATYALLNDAPLLLQALIDERAEVIQLNKIIEFAWEVMDDQTAVEFNDLIIELNGEAEQRWEEE